MTFCCVCRTKSFWRTASTWSCPWTTSSTTPTWRTFKTTAKVSFLLFCWRNKHQQFNGSLNEWSREGRVACVGVRLTPTWHVTVPQGEIIAAYSANSDGNGISLRCHVFVAEHLSSEFSRDFCDKLHDARDYWHEKRPGLNVFSRNSDFHKLVCDIWTLTSIRLRNNISQGQP